MCLVPDEEMLKRYLDKKGEESRWLVQDIVRLGWKMFNPDGSTYIQAHIPQPGWQRRLNSDGIYHTPTMKLSVTGPPISNEPVCGYHFYTEMKDFAEKCFYSVNKFVEQIPFRVDILVDQCWLVHTWFGSKPGSYVSMKIVPIFGRAADVFAVGPSDHSITDIQGVTKTYYLPPDIHQFLKDDPAHWSQLADRVPWPPISKKTEASRSRSRPSQTDS